MVKTLEYTFRGGEDIGMEIENRKGDRGGFQVERLKEDRDRSPGATVAHIALSYRPTSRSHEVTKGKRRRGWDIEASPTCGSPLKT